MALHEKVSRSFCTLSCKGRSAKIMRKEKPGRPPANI